VYRFLFILSSHLDYERTPVSTGRVFRGQVGTALFILGDKHSLYPARACFATR
jgi:hypothetical protein